MEAFGYRYNPDRHPYIKPKLLVIATTLETASMRLELLSRSNILVSAQRRSLPSMAPRHTVHPVHKKGLRCFHGRPKLKQEAV